VTTDRNLEASDLPEGESVDPQNKRLPLAVTVLATATALVLLAVAVGLIRGISEAVIAAVAGLVAATTALVRVLLGSRQR
jgi:hypothetical protein